MPPASRQARPMDAKKKHEEDVKTLKKAEQLVVTSLEHASAAFKGLSIEPSDFEVEEASTKFLTDIHNAQRLIRKIISTLDSDLPFENATLNHLINADLGVQRTAHVHRSLLKTLHNLEAHANTSPNAPPTHPPIAPADAADDVLMKNPQSVTEELVDSSGMTPPADLMS